MGAQRNDVRTYGEAGLRLVEALRDWLKTAASDELLTLQSKLEALFSRIHRVQDAA